MEPIVKNTRDFENLPLEETLNILNASGEGLTEIEARGRLERYGYNEIVEKRKNPLLDFLLRYWGPMPWLLELAMILSIILRHDLEGLIIFVLLTVNAVIGHLHARGSQRAVALLKQKLAIRAKLLRDGQWVIRESKEIVPGDIITVGLGDIVPADARLISGELSVDQSALTGESLPVRLHGSGVLYSGSVVGRGEARALVVNTGTRTFFGKTTELVKIARPKSHQNDVMMAIVKNMMILGIAASLLVTAYALFMHTGILLIMTFVLIFLMGAVPVALPAVLTIVQSVGAMELAKRGALVTRLAAIEDAASIDVLCLDKTGTITRNQLSVIDSLPLGGNTPDAVINLAAIASRQEGMDPIDLAVLDYARAHGVDLSPYRQKAYTPFEPSLKRTEAVIEASGRTFRVVKGAAQVVISLCPGLDQALRKKAEDLTDALSRKGYRTIAVARSEDDRLEELKLVGLLPLADPPRPDSKGIIAEARKLGIKPMMLTGDHIAIAREIAVQAGIGEDIIRLGDLQGLSEAEQVRRVAESDGFAEIYPEDKYRIVRLLQSKGHMVGMTGDGVNDAPALKQAEMGVAVSNSTDVAKASASVVLTEPGIGVIIDTVIISRQTYQRMLTWVLNKVTKVMAFVGLLTLGFFWLDEVVLSLLGMSLLVFANDFVTMSLATDNVEHTPSPNQWNVRNITLASLVPSVLLVGEGLLVILMGLNVFHLDPRRLRTLVLLNLVFSSQFKVLIVRERRHFWSSRPGRELLVLCALTLIGFILLGIYGILTPELNPYPVLVVLAFSAFFTLAIDFPKYYMFKKIGL
jgi:H+-transporting ATPase